MKKSKTSKLEKDYEDLKKRIEELEKQPKQTVIINPIVVPMTPVVPIYPKITPKPYWQWDPYGYHPRWQDPNYTICETRITCNDNTLNTCGSMAEGNFSLNN